MHEAQGGEAGNEIPAWVDKKNSRIDWRENLRQQVLSFQGPTQDPALDIDRLQGKVSAIMSLKLPSQEEMQRVLAEQGLST